MGHEGCMGGKQAERGGRYSGSSGNDAAVEAARRRAVPTLTRSGPHKREFISESLRNLLS